MLDVPKATKKCRGGTDIRHLFAKKLTRPETELISKQSKVLVAFSLQLSQRVFGRENTATTRRVLNKTRLFL